ncbi:MAG TPA: fumarylacetoacetase [Gemmatimonadales bacterium]
MSSAPDRTHDPRLRSWVETANVPGVDFPIQNLPLGVFRRGVEETPRLGVAIGDRVLDLAGAADAGLLSGPATVGGLDQALRAPLLNPLLELGRPAWSALRRSVSRLLAIGEGPRPAPGLLPLAADVELTLPMAIGDYTDFYASIHHATHVGRMFRPEQPLMPNYKYVPVGYHGRASSVVVAGTPVRRPRGQVKDEAAPAPVVEATRFLDYECEVGVVIGPGNPLGEPIPIGRAADHIFGFCLLNDWSARDIQKWEYQPLGPFLAKSFATTISPWIVTADALAPFRAPALRRPDGDPPPLPYLLDPGDQALGGVDLRLEVYLMTERMRREDLAPHRLSGARFLDMYWTPAQLVAHHASNGCNLRPGDLLASGTVSGPDELSLGCLLERTQRGTRPIMLPTGETRRFLEDGDEVILRGACILEGRVPIGFGECRGRIVS